MTVAEINGGLLIKKLNGERFQGRFGSGSYVPVGYCLVHEALGYLGFKDSPFTPYIPCAGVKFLEMVLTYGGIVSCDNILWIKPVGVPCVRTSPTKQFQANKLDSG